MPVWTTALGGRDARVPPNSAGHGACYDELHGTRIRRQRHVYVLEFGTHTERGCSPLEFGDERDGDALEFGADDDAALEFGADLDVALEFGADH